MSGRSWLLWLFPGVGAMMLMAIGFFTLREFGVWNTVVKTQPLPGQVLVSNLSPDGRLLVFVGSNQRLVKVLEITSGAVRDIGKGSFGGARWSADSRYLYFMGFDGRDSIYDFRDGSSRQIPHTLFEWWAADGSWLAVREKDRSVKLWPASGSEDPLPLFPAGIEPLVVNGEGQSLGVRRSDKVRELVKVDRPGAAMQIVDSDWARVFAARDGRSWLLSRKDDRLDLQREGEAPMELIPADRCRDFVGAWSPDGKWVAVICRKMERGYEVRLFSADGTPHGHFEDAISGSLSSDQGIWWSPDSRYFTTATSYVPIVPMSANRVHRFDIQTNQHREWRLPYIYYFPLKDIQFVDEHTVLATLRDTLYRFDLK